MDKIAVIRSLVGLRDEHSSFQNLTGFPMGQSQREGKPSFGSVIAGCKDPLIRSFHRSLTFPGHATPAIQQSRTRVSRASL